MVILINFCFGASLSAFCLKKIIIKLVMECYTYLMRTQYFIKQSHLCFILSKRHIDLLLVEIELLSKVLLYYVTLNTNKHFMGWSTCLHITKMCHASS